MAISLQQLEQVLAELRPLLVGSYIQKISQPLPDALSFEIRRPGCTWWLFLSAHPQTARLHALTQRLPNPSTPPPFCQYLRRHILGARIKHVEQVRHDRVIVFELQKPDRRVFFIAALTGRSANLFVVDEQGSLLRALKPHSQREDHISLWMTDYQERRTTKSDIPVLLDLPATELPVSRMLEQSYAGMEQEEAQRQDQAQRLAALRKAIKKTQRRIAALTQDLEKAKAYQEYGRYGELLKSHVGEIQKGQDQITVIDYYDERLPELTLPLDPTKDPTWNLNDYFRKHRKFLGAERELRPRLEQAQEQLAQLTEEYRKAEKGDMTIRDQASAQQASLTRKHSATKPSKALPYRQFISEDGFSILVGRSAKENDLVTFKIAKQDDLWLHARGTPGSHVIIQLQKAKQVPPETLKDAATLALFYSDLRKSGKGEVIYTFRKHVRKPRGAHPGSVTVTQEKTTWVYLDQNRLERLKDSSPS